MAFVYDDAAIIRWLGMSELSDNAQVGILEQIKNEVDWRVIEQLETSLTGDLLAHFKSHFGEDFPAEIAFVEQYIGSLDGVFQRQLATVLREVLQAEAQERNELLL